jgi:hypothetical protein
MKEKTYEERLESINSGVATLHEEIAAIAAGLKRLSERKNGKASVNEAFASEVPLENENLNASWTRFRHRLDGAGAQSRKIANGVAAEIERHPLIGALTTFGLGFAIAKMLFRGRH